MRWFERYTAKVDELRKDTALLKAVAACEDAGVTPPLATVLDMAVLSGEWTDDEAMAALDRLEDRSLVVAVATDAGVLYATTSFADYLVRR